MSGHQIEIRKSIPSIQYTSLVENQTLICKLKSFEFIQLEFIIIGYALAFLYFLINPDSI